MEWGTFGGRRAVIEEVLMGKDPFADVTPEKVRQIYAHIRKNQEKAMRHAEAGDFFIGEMEMRRWALAPGSCRRSWLRRNVFSWLGIYNAISRYGESVSRPVKISVGWIVFFVLVRYLMSGKNLAGLCLFQRLQLVWECFQQSVLAFFQVRAVDNFDAVQRIGSGLLLGFIYVAMKRQFERHS